MSSNPPVRTDARGVPVSACDPRSLEDFEKALYQFNTYFGDPTETLAVTLENDPEFVLGHVFNASAMLLMSERKLLPTVRDSIEKAEALSSKSNEREKGLVSAARHWMEGRWDEAGRAWDRVLADNPRDLLALQCGHLTDFYLGDSVNLRDRIGRVISQWDRDTPGYSYVLGMQAFGLEECNHFERAEQAGRAALDIERRDGWSVHAVAHVMEMQNRFDEGRAFLADRSDDWAPDNGFAFHNWWHLALFHLESLDFEGALELYDRRILPEDSDVSLQLLDASALLWRIHLHGVELGDRWSKNAELWSGKTPLENGYYAFNDFHAVVALAGAGRIAEAKEVLEAVRAASRENPALTAMMARDIGVPACSAVIAFAEERYADAARLLLSCRTIANRFGGSNAQRDILSQTLIESAIRSGDRGLSRNLLTERAVHKPLSPLTGHYLSKYEAL